ncbi:MAG: 4Fe-4S binding protein [Desulfosarcina sp.]|nr:4Fe-4S binding protein [Desulfobacterales bacterium]
MAADLYRKLAGHMDNLPGGFPPTATDVEIRILKRLFRPEEAELALYLTLIPEAPGVVARRAKISKEEAARRLEGMAKKGLLFRVEEMPGKPAYMAAQFVIGIWEFHVNDLAPGLVKDMEEYIPYLKDTAWKIPQLRTIPVGKSIHNELKVLTYEKAEELVANHDRFSISPCICRRERKLVGEGCDKPEENCLTFGIAADFAVRNGFGRASDKQEILEVLQQANEVGLVLQPGNSREVNYICCCCGCCCAALRTINRFPKPAAWVSSPFLIEAQPDTCEGCGVCQERCQMKALSLVDGRVALDADRCIGCGLCVSTCPTESLILKRKPENVQTKISRNMMTSVYALGRARGKLGLGELLKMQVKSKVDRLLAPR